MKRFFYSRLAAVNLRNNRNTYLPYLLTCSCAVITFYTMYALSLNPGLSALPGSSDITFILGLGTWVIGIFSVVLMLYTNSFLMKRRKKELGLYSILGMEKRHIAHVFFQETLMIAAVCLFTGLAGGILLGKLLFLILLMALRVETHMVFTIPLQAVSGTLILFSLIFLVILLFNLLQIRLANPITLLHGSQEGEKEPKSSWILTVIGLLALGTGYGIAVSVQSPMQAILLFFAAVLLVITGTFALFTSGSIAVLKLLRKKKSFYYKPEHFIAVSGMMYRMKQNAAGLSSICILSTMVLITVSTTVSLYIGAEDSLRFRYPQEIFISFHDNEDVDALHAVLDEMPTIPGAFPENPAEYRTMIVSGKLENGVFSPPDESEFGFESSRNLFLIPLEDYNRMEDATESLAPGEILIYSDGPDYGLDSLQTGGKCYRIKKELSTLRIAPKGLGDITTSYYVFLPNIDSVSSLGASLNLNSETSLYRRIVFDVDGSSQAVMQYAATLLEKLHSLPDYSPFFQSRSLNRDNWFSTYGGFLFLGVFLGLLFLMATVLIIYYKQISEGYDDRERFVIMQKVGMSQKEIRRTIGQQIRMVFFLPLVFAAVHVIFAFSIICKLLLPFGLNNTRLYFLCIVCTFLVFASAYMLVYRLTAKTYYKLVR